MHLARVVLLDWRYARISEGLRAGLVEVAREERQADVCKGSEKERAVRDWVLREMRTRWR